MITGMSLVTFNDVIEEHIVTYVQCQLENR
jgi:hypothetical protein